MSVHSAHHQGNNLTISHNANRLALSREWGGGTDVFNYDLSGRPWNIFLENISYSRGLDNSFVAKWISPDQGRQRRRLDSDEADEMIKLASQTAKHFLEMVGDSSILFEPALQEDTLSNLKKAVEFDVNKARREAQQYRQIYLPVGILPPDQYMAVLLQATEGCSFNQCTFCRFYEGRPFRIKTADEFRQHTHQVRQFLGDGLSVRRTIFLGDANALVVPTARLLDQMRIVHEVFDVSSLGGIFAFLDGFSGEKKSVADYQELAALGLMRVYIGLESGHNPLLEFLNKPGTAEDAIAAVRKIKSAGISVGVIILLGAGGQRFSDGHQQDTVKVLQAMDLDLHDQIYFSELIELEGARYSLDAFTQELKPLSPVEIEHQWQEIQVGLHYPAKSGTPHMARYDIREFIY